MQVWSRRGADFSYRFPGIAEAVRGLSADEALIDGEAVVLRIDGRSDFHALMTKRGGAEATLVAFDLLRVNGDDLRLRPLEARREALQRLVPNVRHGILFSEALAAEGAVVFKKACELGLGHMIKIAVTPEAFAAVEATRRSARSASSPWPMNRASGKFGSTRGRSTSYAPCAALARAITTRS